ncbi:UvrABC system protein C [compost metagenome]
MRFLQGRDEAVVDALVARMEAASAAQRYEAAAELRDRIGRLRQVQEQQLTINAARTGLLRVQSERRLQRVNLHLALGGDFAPDA